MGKKNNAICSYLEKPDKFADFINGSLYKGRQVICPEQVREWQSVYTKEGKARDVIKRICDRDNNCILPWDR